jgi:hypothetical protein
VRRLLSDPYRFVSTGGNDRYLRSPDGWSRREPDMAGRDRERLSWAESTPTGVDSRKARPESRPKPPFRCERETGFTTLFRQSPSEIMC